MTVDIDAAGNLRGCYPSRSPAARRLYLGSHLDTVPQAGAFDGVLGVILAITLVELLSGRLLKFHVEIVGFSEEEGVRFGVPFIGSRAFAGTLDAPLLSRRDASGISISDAIRTFGLDPSQLATATAGAGALGYLEFHIEQGPVLESLNIPLAVVEAISGQSRLTVTFEGHANHAGTTPMHFRHDALAGGAEWVSAVETEARSITGMVATVGQINVEPGATNVIPSHARASLDVRHADDQVRTEAVARLVEKAAAIASRRGLTVACAHHLNQPAVAMDASFIGALERMVACSGYPVHRMVSGAGHDAMIVAQRMPAAMLFLRSPGGISHHPDETVLAEDVAAALATGLRFLDNLEDA